jgi:hypothetical protein
MMTDKIILAFFILITFKANAAEELSTLTLAQNSGADVEAISDKPKMKVRTTAQSVKQPKGENLLDFEAEVIEGEKKRPELFLDIKAGDGDVGSGLYIRPNFDDFFIVDKKRRARFIKSK